MLQVRDLMESKKMTLVGEIKALIQKEWRPLRDTRVEEDLNASYTTEQQRYTGKRPATHYLLTWLAEARPLLASHRTWAHEALIH